MSITETEPAVRIVDRLTAGWAGERSACCVSGCASTTSSGKPYCIAHIDLLSYVQKLRRELAVREQDMLVTREVDVAGPLCVEIRENLLRHGQRSFAGLGHELGVSGPSLDAHVRALEKAGFVRDFKLKLGRGDTKRVVAANRGELRHAV